MIHALAGGVAPFCTYEVIAIRSVSDLECTAGTTRLEPATSAVTVSILKGIVRTAGSLHKYQIAAQGAQLSPSFFSQPGIADYGIDLRKRYDAGHTTLGELAGVSHQNDLA
jgi:hypothetical protein